MLLELLRVCCVSTLGTGLGVTGFGVCIPLLTSTAGGLLHEKYWSEIMFSVCLP